MSNFQNPTVPPTGGSHLPHAARSCAFFPATPGTFGCEDHVADKDDDVAEAARKVLTYIGGCRLIGGTGR
jgi:hypothetical protein